MTVVARLMCERQVHLARELDGLASLLRQQPKHEHAPK
jgi:hypothetical protein